VIPATNNSGVNAIPGATVSLTTTAVGGQDFKASTPYLILFENDQDALNFIAVGSFTSTADGRIPLGVSFEVPDTALNGQHNILIAEDADANGEYDATADAIVIGPNALTATVFANALVSNYIRHVGDSVTVTMQGLNPENETDPAQATIYQVLVDQDGNGPQSSDPVFPDEGFTPNKDGQAEITFTVPEMPGGCINLYVIEKDTLNRAEPQTLVNFVGLNNDGDGADEDAEIFVTPNIALDHYTGNAGDTVAVSGKAFVPGVQYAVTFGLLNDVAVNQRGQVVTNFIADSNGLVPSGVTFTVPTANNSSYGVVVTPTPAANYVDVALDTGVGLNSAMLAGDQPVYTVGGVAATLVSARASTTDDTQVLVTFSGVLQSATANNTANFTVVDQTTSTTVAVTGAAYNGADYTVLLTLAAALEDGSTYQVTVSNVRDSFNNPVSGVVEFTVAGVQPAPDAPSATEVTGDDRAGAVVTLGSVVTGGDEMNLKVNYPPYDAPVDIYVGVGLPDGSIWLVASDGSLTPDLVAYATGVTDAQSATVFDSFDVCTPFGASVPEGTWWMYSVVAPTNGGEISAIDWDAGAYDFTYYSFDVTCP